MRGPRTLVAATATAATTAALALLPVMPAAHAAEAAAGRPFFQVPFVCGQTWVGGTRSDHSPQLAIDFNHYGANGPDDKGRRVVASAGGTVQVHFADGQNDPGGYGKWIEINHGDGWWTRYAHLMAGSAQVKDGDHVNRGDVIAKVGETGNVTGAHLHYEQRHSGDDVRIEFYDGIKALYYGKRDYKSPSC